MNGPLPHGYGRVGRNYNKNRKKLLLDIGIHCDAMIVISVGDMAKLCLEQTLQRNNSMSCVSSSSLANLLDT